MASLHRIRGSGICKRGPYNISPFSAIYKYASSKYLELHLKFHNLADQKFVELIKRRRSSIVIFEHQRVHLLSQEAINNCVEALLRPKECLLSPLDLSLHQDTGWLTESSPGVRQRFGSCPMSTNMTEQICKKGNTSTKKFAKKLKLA